MKIPVNLVFEDELSEYVLSSLLGSFGNKYQIIHRYHGRGSGYIKSKINAFNQASIITPFVVLTDLDKYDCPLEILNSWFDKPSQKNMIFRIAVREVEAWLLADIEGFSEFTGVSKSNFPDKPELEPDPKRTLITIIKRSGKRELRQDIIPLNDNASIGPYYNGRLMEFVLDYWDISRARKRSNSLSRAYNSLKLFQYSLPG